MSFEEIEKAEAAKIQRLKTAIAQDNTLADAKADTWLDKLKASKWTAWILLAVALVVSFLIVKAL